MGTQLPEVVCDTLGTSAQLWLCPSTPSCRQASRSMDTTEKGSMMSASGTCDRSQGSGSHCESRTHSPNRQCSGPHSCPSRLTAQVALCATWVHEELSSSASSEESKTHPDGVQLSGSMLPAKHCSAAQSWPSRLPAHTVPELTTPLQLLLLACPSANTQGSGAHAGALLSSWPSEQLTLSQVYPGLVCTQWTPSATRSLGSVVPCSVQLVLAPSGTTSSLP